MKKLTVLSCLAVAYFLAPTAYAESISSGSGFFITQDGYFVTNFHVIEDSKEISIVTRTGDSLPATVIRTDKKNDIAILKAKGTFAPLPIGNSRLAKPGQRVIAVGYPHVDVQGREAKVTDGIINSVSGIRDDPRVFQISVPVQSGNSGGPLVTQDGNVVGIVVAKLSALSLLKETGDLPQNVNYAIKSNYLFEVLASIVGLEEKLATPNHKKFRETDELAATVERSTALVLAKATSSVTKSSERKIDTAPAKPQSTRSLSTEDVMAKVSRGDFTTDYSMGVITPDKAENGSVVPFFVNLSSPISSADKLLVIVNEKYLAYVASPIQGTTMSHLSGRVKMPSGPGSIRGVVVTADGQLKSSSKNLNVVIGVQSTDNSETSSANPVFKHKTLDSNGLTEIKLLMESPSSSVSYIKSVTTTFSSGGAVVWLTPFASKNPFVGFKVSRPMNPSYRITVNDNQGSSSTADGQAY